MNKPLVVTKQQQSRKASSFPRPSAARAAQDRHLDRSALSAERCPNYLRNLSWPQPQVSTEEQRAPSSRLLTWPHLQHPQALPDSMIARQPLIYSLQSLGNRYTCTRPGLREPHKAKGKRKCIQMLAVISLDGRTWNEWLSAIFLLFQNCMTLNMVHISPPHTHTQSFVLFFTFSAHPSRSQV